MDQKKSYSRSRPKRCKLDDTDSLSPESSVCSEELDFDRSHHNSGTGAVKYNGKNIYTNFIFFYSTTV